MSEPLVRLAGLAWFIASRTIFDARITGLAVGATLGHPILGIFLSSVLYAVVGVVRQSRSGSKAAPNRLFLVDKKEMVERLKSWPAAHALLAAEIRTAAPRMTEAPAHPLGSVFDWPARFDNAMALPTGPGVVFVERDILISAPQSARVGSVAHELGHLANGGARRAVARGIISLVASVLGLIVVVVVLLAGADPWSVLLGWLGFESLRTLLTGVLSRREEFRADRVAERAGYGAQVAAALTWLEYRRGNDRLLAIRLADPSVSHPRTQDRLALLPPPPAATGIRVVISGASEEGLAAVARGRVGGRTPDFLADPNVADAWASDAVAGRWPGSVADPVVNEAADPSVLPAIAERLFALGLTATATTDDPALAETARTALADAVAKEDLTAGAAASIAIDARLTSQAA